MSVGFAGSSNTYAPTGYSAMIQSWLTLNQPAYIFAFTNIAQNGWATFPNLVNKADLAAANVIILDQSNDGADDQPEYEAFLRKASAAGQRVIAILNPSWDATTDDQINIPNNLTAINNTRAILSAYGVAYVDGLILTQAHVAGGGHITDWWTDTAHWNATGQAVIAAAVEALLPNGGGIPTPLPTRINEACADFENAPTIKLGTAYDSRTGVWTDTGSSVASSEVGATITYSGTFRKFGVYRADGNYPTVTVTIDGGAPINNFTLYPNGYDIGTRDAHTIVITVTSAVQIDKFWAM